MNTKELNDLEPGVYEMYGAPVKFFNFTLYTPFIGAFSIDPEDRFIMTTSNTDHHNKISDFPSLYFKLNEDGDFNNNIFLVNHINTFQRVANEERMSELFEEFKSYLKKTVSVKFIQK